jgi:hypothetical protein
MDNSVGFSGTFLPGVPCRKANPHLFGFCRIPLLKEDSKFMDEIGMGCSRLDIGFHGDGPDDYKIDMGYLSHKAAINEWSTHRDHAPIYPAMGPAGRSFGLGCFFSLKNWNPLRCESG